MLKGAHWAGAREPTVNTEAVFPACLLPRCLAASGKMRVLLSSQRAARQAPTQSDEKPRHQNASSPFAWGARGHTSHGSACVTF